MKQVITKKLTVSALSVLATCLMLQACDKKAPAVPAPPTVTAAAPVAASAPPPPTAALPPKVVENTAPPPTALSPTELEELLAPIALYPDGVLAQVLASSTKPQEVLDGGNWLLQNNDLQGKALETAAKTAGFTPPIIALMQFPSVLDMMCMKMDWTADLGEAFLADEPAVLAAVQSLRKKATAMGNLPNSAQMKVENQTMNNQEVITVTSPDPQVVYVPQYDPVTTYTTPAPAATAASTTTTTTEESSGFSSGELLTTGVLAFGAGILVNEVFSDDDDEDDYEDYYPAWGGGGGYYPPPYNPAYGNGFHPSHQYNNSFNNNNVFVKTGSGDYWNKYDGNRRRSNGARGDRNDIGGRNDIGDRDGIGGRNSYDGAKRDRNDVGGRNDIGGRNSYDGARGGRNEIGGKNSYDGAKGGRNDIGAGSNTRPATREIAKNRPTVDNDRGRAKNNVARQQPAAKIPNRQAADRKQSAFQGARNSGSRERAASQRGKASVQRQGGRANKGGGRAGGRRG